MAGFGGHRLDGKGPLSYMGVRPVTPAQFITSKRAPTTSDFQGYAINTQWLYVNPTDATKSIQYVLTSVAEGVATWLPLNSSDTSIEPNHSVLLGTGTTAISSVGPDAAIGLPLVSQGASADPSFEVLTVSGGGTGLDVVSPYAVVLGGITGEGPLQVVSGLGTTGYVLTSNGLGTKPTWQPSQGGGGGSGSPISIQVFDASGTYTPTVGMTSCIVELVGGGGGGQNATSTSFSVAGGGGGGGGYCRRLFLASDIGASKAVVIGAGGGPGLDGDDSTFGVALLTARGGFTPVDYTTGGLGGTSSGGDINIDGGSGGISSGNQAADLIFGGFGGSSFYGSGGVALGGVDATGINGLSYGSGGSGGLADSISETQDGGSGKDGICIITEFGNLPGDGVATLTGNTGGAVGPDGSSNINIIGSGSILVAGNPGTNTLTISTSSSPIEVNTIYLTTPGSGTYTPTAGMFQARIECIGGGGGGGSKGEGLGALGAGGGGGGYCSALLDAATIGASQPYVVGAGGTGTTTTGNNGALSRFGSIPFLISGGGTGGGGNISAVVGGYSQGGIGGTANGGDLNVPGGAGGNGWYIAPSGASVNLLGFTGVGGITPLSTGAASQVLGQGGVSNGFNAAGYGGGGSGAKSPLGSTSSPVGGNGSNGVIIITEYIS